MIDNPIRAWVGGRGTGRHKFFARTEERFHSTFQVPTESRAAVREFAREIVDWRLAEYLQRGETSGASEDIVCKVAQTGGRPILFLPSRDQRSDIPDGWIAVEVNHEPHRANFVKIAVNVLRSNHEDTNVLPAVLRDWFGPDAGMPGTNFRVTFKPDGDGYRM